MDDVNLDLIANTSVVDANQENTVPLKKQLPLGTNKRCNVCGNSYRFLARHLDTHGPYNCIECLLNFPSCESLNGHISEYHDPDKLSFRCEFCQTVFSNVTKLALHKFKHTGKFTCPLCNTTFKGKYKHSLINHIRRHEGSFEEFCNICGQGFVAKHYLQRHMEIHEDIPKYKCDICQKKFTVKR